ncbi:MAG: hypothetical protein E7177_02065 [Erysipelotrichaceae bacterium]|nr:hypothetical protein [Erysipelotrichaceae bacterium]
MKKNDSIYQLVLSLAFIILGGICFIPNVNFLQQLICFTGIVITVIGLIFFIKGVTKEYDMHSRKILVIVGLVIALLGISFSTLVWVLFEIFAIALGIIFILYSIIGLFIVVKDKYGLKKVRILSTTKNIIYLSIGILLIVDCITHHLSIDFTLGGLLILDGTIGIITYISSYKNYHQVIDVDHYESEEIDSKQHINDDYIEID